MTIVCKICAKEMAQAPQSSRGTITNGICESCAGHLPSASSDSELLEAIDAPVLLMQGNPRQVVTANKRALELFVKELPEVEGHRGGQVFDCVHSFTEAGCGKDRNCDDCMIKKTIIDTFMTSRSFNGVSAYLQVKKVDGIKTFLLQISTEKIGDLALIRINRYEKA